MSREFEGLGGGLESSMSTDLNVDVAEDDERVIVTADLPGFASDDIDVDLRDDTLTIAATQGTEEDEEGGDDDVRFHHRERQHRAVSRRISLPAPVEREEASASYNNGVLTVTLPKQSSDSDGHRIDVN